MKKRRKQLKARRKRLDLFYLSIILVALVVVVYSIYQYNIYRSRAESPKTIKLGTFTPPLATLTPSPTVPGALNTPPGAQFSQVGTKIYCVDEAPGTVLIESCDDKTRCDVAHGAGGPSGSCGTVISQEHSIIESLLGNSGKGPYYNQLSNDLLSPIQSSCYTAQPFSPYISTFNVIDAYNLAGFADFSRAQHADAAYLESAWKTTALYTTSTTVDGATPGDVVFFSNPPHAGIINTVEVDARGNGEIWFLHTNATYYLGKLIVAGWSVVASSTGDNSVIFGSHVSKRGDETMGETVCYCGGGVCYRFVF